MKCDEVQRRLSAYLEYELTAEEQTQVGEHLKSCAKCSKSHAELIKAIERVKGVGEVEPPPYLTQKIIAAVKEEARQRRLLQWLLYPLHVKLPLEIAATVIVVITAVYIYHAAQPEFKFVEAPMQDIAEQKVSKEEVQRKAAGKDETAPMPTPLAKKEKKEIITPPAVKELQKFELGKEPEIPKTKALEMPPSPVHKDERDKIAFTAKEPEKVAPSEMPEVVESKPVETLPPSPQAAKEDKVGLSGITAGKKALKEEAPALEANVKPFIAEEKKAVTTITLKVQSRESAEQEIHKVLGRLNAKIIATEHPENRTIISAQLDAKKLKELIARMKELGEVEEKDVSLEEREGIIGISIQIETASAPVR